MYLKLCIHCLKYEKGYSKSLNIKKTKNVMYYMANCATPVMHVW